LGYRAAASLLLALTVAACADAASSAAPVLVAGASAENDCERQVVARAEAARDGGATAAERLDADVYAACTYDEFVAANDKLADAFRYTGDIQNHVGRRCLRLTSLYRGSRLCESLPQS
jgi:hypothetical protein